MRRWVDRKGLGEEAGNRAVEGRDFRYGMIRVSRNIHSPRMRLASRPVYRVHRLPSRHCQHQRARAFPGGGNEMPILVGSFRLVPPVVRLLPASVRGAALDAMNPGAFPCEVFPDPCRAAWPPRREFPHLRHHLLPIWLLPSCVARSSSLRRNGRPMARRSEGFSTSASSAASFHAPDADMNQTSTSRLVHR